MIRSLAQKIWQLQSLMPKTQWRPPGHFYSPIPSLEEVRRREAEIFVSPPSLPGVDLNERGQLELLHQLAELYHTQPFSPHKTGLRYFFENANFSYGDGVILHCMIRHLKPRRIIEIGSGYSSCVTLDTNERFFENRIECTFIEPYPELLCSLLHPGDQERIAVLSSDLQDVDPVIFSALAPGDILFVDSTHVAKVGSDVNYIFFRILPLLPAGVHIHFHDIFYPFEYPKEWIYEGRAWNENYLLHAFLQYNAAFEITFFNSYLAQFHAGIWGEKLPLCMRNTGGSIWLRKIS